jgi:sec-independent protein translocase protein TatA
MPFGIQPIHIIIIVIVALLIFGPSRLPELGRSLGKGLTEFRRGTREMTEGFREEIVKSGDESSAASQQSIQPPMTASPPSSAQPQAASPVTGNFCIQCGSSNLAGARFCNKCGAQLPAEMGQSS